MDTWKTQFTNLNFKKTSDFPQNELYSSVPSPQYLPGSCPGETKKGNYKKSTKIQPYHDWKSKLVEGGWKNLTTNEIIGFHPNWYHLINQGKNPSFRNGTWYKEEEDEEDEEENWSNLRKTIGNCTCTDKPVRYKSCFRQEKKCYWCPVDETEVGCTPQWSYYPWSSYPSVHWYSGDIPRVCFAAYDDMPEHYIERKEKNPT